MKRQWKRALSCVLSLAILFSSTVYAAPVATAERSTILNLNLDNNALTDKDGVALPVAADGIYDMLDAEGWKWDNNTLTLTLNGLNMNLSTHGAILLPANAVIELIGSNSIVCGAEYGNGITGFESLTIKGDGAIVINSKLVGIYSSGNLSITGGTINVKSTADSAILANDELKISGSADITTSAYYCGLQANGSGISISGATVEAASSNDAAIYTKGALAISDFADVTATNPFYAGINAAEGITITDSTVTAGSGTNYTAIYTPQSVVIGGSSKVTADGDWIGICADISISIDGDAEVTVTGKSTGLQAVDTQISGNAKVKATSEEASAISGKDNLSITGNAEVVATGAQAGIVGNGSMTLSAKDVRATGGWYGIDNEDANENDKASGITIGGKLTAEATLVGHGIYSIKSITADARADITATGAYSGISAKGDITFNGSKADAIGADGCGITTTGMITINGGSIHAKGSAGYTAIRTENVQTADEAAKSKISLANLIEKNGGKVAFSDWVGNSGEIISWTTFISKDDDGLAMVEGGLFTNGLLEVWLSEPYSGGGGSTPSTSNPPTVTDSTEPNTPTDAKIEVKATVDSTGKATANVRSESVSSAIKAAQDAAKKNGTEKNGISVTIGLTTAKAASSIAATLPASSISALVKAGVTELRLESSTGEMRLDLDTLKAIQAAGVGNVTVGMNKADVSKLSLDAQKAIGSRPVFELSITVGGEAVTAFDGGLVTVGLPYTPAASENPDNLRCVYVDDGGKVTWLESSRYNAVAKSLYFESGHFSTFGIGYREVPDFTDISGHWAEEDILFVAGRGLLTDTSATTFDPNGSMTRGMFVTALGRLAGVEAATYANTTFTDVDADAYYAPYVAWAAEKNITNGTTKTTFSPDKTITRQELAVLMANYAGVMGYTLPETREAVTFADGANVASWAADAVGAMQVAGIMGGKGGNRFDPAGTATRAEVSAVLRRFVELVVDPTEAQEA